MFRHPLAIVVAAPLVIACWLSQSTGQAPPANTAGCRVVVPDCRLTVTEKQDVPSQHDGVILFVGTDLGPDEKVAPEDLITVRVGNEQKRYRRLREGDTVKSGQLLAGLDDRYSRDEWAIKSARLAAAKADLEAAQKNCDESKNKYETQLWLRQEGRGAAAEEDVRTAKLTWERAAYEAIAKREAVVLAERELSQAETVLRMHEVHAATGGILKTCYKHTGEAVHFLDPVFQIHDLSRLRVEGLVDVYHLPYLHAGMKAHIETCATQGPQQTLVGHLREITSVAVSNKGQVVSASHDGTVRVWDRATERETAVHVHPAGVLAVACTLPGAASNLCLSGAADGKGRLWDLNAAGDKPVGELAGQHAGGITGVAFSPDGKTCASGGEDREICLWDTASGALRYRFPAGHRAAVTALHFTPTGQVVSAGRDDSLRVWTLGTDGARLTATFEHRGGEVSRPGVSADGKRVLHDQGGTFHVLALPDGRNEGALSSVPPGSHFAAFADFSPDGRFILTASSAEGRLQLWRTPIHGVQAAPLRQLVAPDPATATCAAFAPDGRFIVAGASDRRMRIWNLPPGDEIDQPIAAVVTLVDRAVESSTRQARLWAEVANPDLRLLPGTSVTLVIDAEAP